jgi:hypothetical protein
MTRVQSLADFKTKFDDMVDSRHVKIDWDAGHCYAYVDHEILGAIDELQEEDAYEAHAYVNEFADNFAGANNLYACRPDVYEGKLEEVSSCGCLFFEEELTDEDYCKLESFINSAESSWASESAKNYYSQPGGLIQQIKKIMADYEAERMLLKDSVTE